MKYRLIGLLKIIDLVKIKQGLHNKGMQSDKHARYARTLAADAGR